MEMLARLLAAALAHLAGLAVGQGGFRSTEASEPASGRVEHFALELTASEADALVAPEVEAEGIGLAVLRQRREGPRTVLEWELRFEVPGEVDTRVHHVEVHEGAETKLVWREYRPGAGRTLILLASGAELRTVEWGGRDGLREEVAQPEGGLFPLELLERARAARLSEGEVALFEPLDQRFERVELFTRVEAGAHPASFAPPACGDQPERWAADSARLARTLAIHRRDGSLAGAYRFVGSDLVAFQWQAGAARGRRIPADEWRRRSERLDQADSSDGP
jgi:hypothetical protein